MSVEEAKNYTQMAVKVPIPVRLLPYLERLKRTGLWGTHIDHVVERLVEQGILREITAGNIGFEHLSAQRKEDDDGQA